MTRGSGRLPQTVGLFCAIPLTREEFYSDLHQPAPHGDYAKNVLCADGTHRPDIAWQIHESRTDFIREKLLQMEALGVEVHRRATTSALIKYLSQYQVLIIVAHWKGHQLFISDMPRPYDLATRLLHDTHGEIQFLRELIGFEKLNSIDAARQGPRSDLASLLQSTFEGLTEDHDLLPGGENPDRVARNRDHLDDTFMPLIHPGNRMEFVDRLMVGRNFVEMIPKSYDGVLDLTICHSVNLANLLLRNRPSCTCLSNAQEASPDWRLTRLTAICRVMSVQGIEFLPALSTIRDMMDDHLARSIWH